MNGHIPLMSLRRSGKRPRAVWINDTDNRIDKITAGDWHHERNCMDGAWHAHIRLTAEDMPETADFRALKGLVVHVRSDRGEARFQRLCRAVCAAGASQVVGVNNEKLFAWSADE